MIEQAFLVLMAAGLGIMLWLILKSGMNAHVQMRERAMRQFRSTLLNFPLLDTCFNGREAEVLESHASHYLAGLTPSNYVLTVKGRMPDGVEFEFKSDPAGKPWVICRSRGGGGAVRARAPY